MKKQQNTNTQKISGIRNEFVAPPKYEQESIIGTGGMKTVIRVRDAETDRSVALAVAKKFSNGSMKQFTREALLTAGLEHPNIVPVHEIGITADGIPYFTMKLLSGETLQDIIGKLQKRDAGTVRQYPLEAMLGIFLKICDGVSFAHSKGVYHLDLKPANIQVGKFGEVLVLDWGLARTAGGESEPDEKINPGGVQGRADATQDGVVRGTPEYMAPEQALGRNRLRGPKWDIYSLGGILHAMLTLHPPVEDTGDRKEMFRRVVSGRLYGFRRGNFFKVPAALQFIVYKAMDRRPAMRYDSVLEMKQDVERYLSGYPALAEKAGFYTKAILFFKRRRNRFFMGLSLFFFCFMLLVLTSARLYYKKLELDIYRHTARMRNDAEQKRKNLEHRLHSESARRWRKIAGPSDKIPSAEFRIAWTLCWTGGKIPFTLCIEPAVKQDGVALCFSPEKGTVSVFRGKKKQLLREDAFVFAPGCDYNFLLEGHPKEDGKAGLSLSVNNTGIFSDFLLDCYASPGKAELKFISDPSIRLSDFSISDLGIPLKTDLPNLAEHFLKRGDFKIASVLFRTAANSSSDTAAVRDALFMAQEAENLSVFTSVMSETENLLKKICETDDLILRMEGISPALIIRGGIFKGDPLLEKLPIRVLRLENTRIPAPRILSRFRLRTLEIRHCGLAVFPVLNREHLQNLVSVGNPVADLSPLQFLQLRRLAVINGKVQDISPIAGMKSLQELDLSGNNISDTEPLKALHLKKLTLRENEKKHDTE